MVDEGAAVHIMSGSNVFCAGFTSPEGSIPEGLDKGTIVAVYVVCLFICVHVVYDDYDLVVRSCGSGATLLLYTRHFCQNIPSLFFITLGR